MTRAGILAAALLAMAMAPSSSAQETTPASPPANGPPAPTSTEREAFDLEDIDEMLRNVPRGELRRAPTATERQQQGVDNRILDNRIRALTGAHMRSCWRQRTGGTNEEHLVVTVEFELNEDGTLRGQPRVTEPSAYAFNPSMRRAVEDAVRAVRACAPYPFPADPIVAGHYDRWRELEFTFRTLNPASR
jgi:hypothetical protein